MALSHYVADVECNLEMWGSMTAPPPPRKRRVAEGGPYYSPRQGGAGRPSGLGAQTLLIHMFFSWVEDFFTAC
jgi:hypothetical protein